MTVRISRAWGPFAMLGLVGCVALPEQGQVLSAVEPAPLPAYAPGTALVYSNGRVEKVISTRNGRTLWADQNDKRFSKSDNFVVPTLSWRTRDGFYTQRLIKGEPDKLFPLGRGERVWFDVLKTTPAGREYKQLWSCEDQGGRRIPWAGSAVDTYLVSCTRSYLKSGYLPSESQRLDYFYAPKVGVVVRVDDIDLSNKRPPRQKRLGKVFAPGVATSERIAAERDRQRSIARSGSGE